MRLHMSADATWTLLLASVAAIFITGCSDDPDPKPIVYKDALGLDVVLDGQGQGLEQAGRDVVEAFARARGYALGDLEAHLPKTLDAVDAPRVIVARVVPARQELAHDDFEIVTAPGRSGQTQITITASSARGAANGLYEITTRWGVHYYHPEQTFYPQDPTLELPAFERRVHKPRFTTRGFHEHTQHPIPMADIYLRPGSEQRRQYASNYVRWMSRNRQNAMSFHALKTIQFDAWTPYISSIVEEAHAHGVQVGLVISFADQQQNNFRLLGAESGLPEEASAEDKIRGGLDRFMKAGFDFVTFQQGTSEFTKPADAEILSWLETARAHLTMGYPHVKILTWIHPPCDLEADDGTNFWHLPTRAGQEVGLMVHTTMYYTLEHPAPVYGCEVFHHQETLMREVNGKRRQVFYPETAWWLGFDNNMPLALPLTGWSRAWDIQKILTKYDVEGHITFTTGREWHYWQYDHYLTRVTWDGELTWEQYLRQVATLYGEAGPTVAEVLDAWTQLQVKDFYVENPLIYFYLAGELTQDELGERAGVLARRPKLAYDRVLQMSEAELERWRRDDLDKLRAMRAAYSPLLERLPEQLPGQPTDQQRALYEELRLVHQLYVLRIHHAIQLYETVLALRPYAAERQAARQEGRQPDMALAMKTAQEAQLGLEAARALSQQAQTWITRGESLYRFPPEMLTKPLPESLTSYPFGYLEETSRAYFWTRRDDQLERLIARVLDPSNDRWMTQPDALFYATSRQTSLKVPSNALAGRVLKSFIPQLLFGVKLDQDARRIIIAEDANENFLPDEGTEVLVDGQLVGPLWRGRADAINLVIYDSSGLKVGDLIIEDADVTMTFKLDGALVTPELESGEIVGEFASSILVGVVTETAGIDIDGASNLIKQVYGVPSDQPLPERLPMHFVFTFLAAPL